MYNNSSIITKSTKNMTAEKRFKCLEEYGIDSTCRCWYCGKPLIRKHEVTKLPSCMRPGEDELSYTIPEGWCRQINEHVIPKSRGGTNHPSNIVDSCNICNCSKGNKNREEYRAYLERKSGTSSYVFYAEKASATSIV
jgi:hypothetical protein